MMIGAEAYREIAKKYSLAKLYYEKENFEEYNKKYENNELPKEEYCICPSPEVVYSMNKEYIEVINELIEQKKNNKEEQYYDPEIHHYVLSVKYEDAEYGKQYNYLSDEDTTIGIGDRVLVDRAGYDAVARVEEARYYTEEDSPFPISKMKKIIKKVEEDFDIDEYEEEDWEEDEEDYEPYWKIEKKNEEYNNILLNTMFSRISIKRLMKIIAPIDYDENWELYYYKKFNTFFYKKVDEYKFKIAEYTNELFDDTMYSIILKESIKVPQKSFAITTDSENFTKAVEFCKNNKLEFHIDVDALEFCEEKRKLNLYKKVERKEVNFKSIDEIIEYVKNIEEQKYEFPDPQYFIEDNKVIFYGGGYNYDWNLLKIPEFLIKNKYVDEKYYNRDKYPELFEEDVSKWDYEKLEIKEISYLLLRSFNIERICEGTIARLVNSGNLLILLKRVKELKEKN